MKAKAVSYYQGAPRIWGNVAIFNLIIGQFLHQFKEKADRLYMADVSGDWREDLIVLSGDRLQIYSNDKPKPNPEQAQLRTQNHFCH